VALSDPVVWYIDRGSGLAALLLLTTAVVLGVISVVRVHSPRWPRFALAQLHRNLALLALVFGVVHVATSVADSFVPIRVADAFIPFGSHYKPFWLAMGTIGADLMLAVLVTTALRRRLGFRAWRSVHLLSYACWAMSVVHAVAIGGDARSVVWGVTIMAACIGAVGGALVQRTASTGTPLVK
jgi:DMSO/TMAO reductase YedYZ heme-binding membrane subunit